jgi:hypothetical protein
LFAADREIIEKQHPLYRAGNTMYNYVSTFTLPVDLVKVPSTPDDFPFNFGRLCQKVGARDGAIYFCLANDYCRRKKIAIEVKNREFEYQKSMKKQQLQLKKRFIAVPIKEQSIHSLNIEESVIKHLRDEHWSLLIQTGYSDNFK